METKVLRPGYLLIRLDHGFVWKEISSMSPHATAGQDVASVNVKLDASIARICCVPAMPEVGKETARIPLCPPKPGFPAHAGSGAANAATLVKLPVPLL